MKTPGSSTGWPSFGAAGSGLERLDHRGQELEDVRHDPDVGDFEDRRARVRVDRDDEPGILHARHVLHRSTDPAGHVELRTHGLSALPDLASLRQPLHVREGPGGADYPAQQPREVLDEREVLLLLDTATRGH